MLLTIVTGSSDVRTAKNTPPAWRPTGTYIVSCRKSMNHCGSASVSMPPWRTSPTTPMFPGSVAEVTNVPTGLRLPEEPARERLIDEHDLRARRAVAIAEPAALDEAHANRAQVSPAMT